MGDDLAPDAALLQSLGVPAGRQVVLYAGNLGDKQGLESIVEAARLLADDTRLYFLVVGEGAGKARMLAQVQELALDNIGFAPLQPEATLPALLASAVCHLVVHQPSPRLRLDRSSFADASAFAKATA